jgi:hypothetical protein
VTETKARQLVRRSRREPRSGRPSLLRRSPPTIAGGGAAASAAVM